MSETTSFDRFASSLAKAARPAIENILVFDRVDSTQACALRLIEQAEAEERSLPRTLVVAQRQDQGRGRGDRHWISPPGGLYLSWIACDLDTSLVAKLPMVSAAAALTAVDGLGIDGVELKWPNDLLIRGGKLAGILVNARHGRSVWATVGMGINLAQVPAATEGAGANPTSVADHLGSGDVETWAASIVGSFVRALSDGVVSPEAGLALWRRRLIHRRGEGMRVRLGDGSVLLGRFTGLTDAGHLRLEVDGEERIVSAGDIVE